MPTRTNSMEWGGGNEMKLYASETADRLRSQGLHSAALEVEWLYRELVWCRQRLRREGYQETLDKHMAEGPTVPDRTPAVLSDS